MQILPDESWCELGGGGKYEGVPKKVASVLIFHAGYRHWCFGQCRVEISKIGMFLLAIATIATPLACPKERVDFGFLLKKTFSITAWQGLNSSIISLILRKISLNLNASHSFSFVLIVPLALYFIFEERPLIIPKPVFLKPGSIPNKVIFLATFFNF